MNYLASIKPPGETAFHVVEFDETGTVSQRWRPPAGRSWHRPVAGPDGRRLWWETKVGGTHEDVFSSPDARLVIEDGGVLIEDGGVLTTVPMPSGWEAWGHPEWDADGAIVLAGKKAGAWAVAWRSPEGRWLDLAGITEPSVAADGRLVGVQADKRTVQIGGRSIPAPKGVDQLFDPFVSPDGTRVVALARTGGLFGTPVGATWSLIVADIATGTWRTVVKVKPWLESVSAARWIDNSTLVASMLGWKDSQRWDAWRFDLASGKRRRLITPGPARDALGSIEYVAPAIWVAS